MSQSVTPHSPRPVAWHLTAGLPGRQVVLTAISGLSTEHRQVLLECYLRGASVADAAEILGVPPGNIKARLHYALHALRQAIDEMGGVA
jgi:RNA polymerase sigma-70 factor (ECF subfamily)